MSKKISAGLKMAALHFLQKKNDELKRQYKA